MVSNIWNNYRYARIILNEIILDQLRLKADQPGCTSDAKDIRDQCQPAQNLIQQLASDICATVPFQFGLVSADKEETTDPVKIKSSIGGFCLLYPIYIAACVDAYGSPTFGWAISCLTIIARAMGIDQALAIAEMLQVESGMGRWVDHQDDEDRRRSSSPIITEVR
jgi:hypothetical protein